MDREIPDQTYRIQGDNQTPLSVELTQPIMGELKWIPTSFQPAVKLDQQLICPVKEFPPEHWH